MTLLREIGVQQLSLSGIDVDIWPDCLQAGQSGIDIAFETIANQERHNEGGCPAVPQCAMDVDRVDSGRLRQPVDEFLQVFDGGGGSVQDWCAALVGK